MRLGAPTCQPRRTPIIRSSADAFRLARDLFEDLPQEAVIAVCLDNGRRVVSAVELALGGIENVEFDARLALGAALAAGAPNVVLMHNHISGDPTPSREDDDLTHRFLLAATLVGVSLEDHIIVAVREFYSYLDTGRLERIALRRL